MTYGNTSLLTLLSHTLPSRTPSPFLHRSHQQPSIPRRPRIRTLNSPPKRDLDNKRTPFPEAFGFGPAPATMILHDLFYMSTVTHPFDYYIFCPHGCIPGGPVAQ